MDGLVFCALPLFPGATHSWHLSPCWVCEGRICVVSPVSRQHQAHSRCLGNIYWKNKYTFHKFVFWEEIISLGNIHNGSYINAIKTIFKLCNSLEKRNVCTHVHMYQTDHIIYINMTNKMLSPIRFLISPSPSHSYIEDKFWSDYWYSSDILSPYLLYYEIQLFSSLDYLLNIPLQYLSYLDLISRMLSQAGFSA